MRKMKYTAILGVILTVFFISACGGKESTKTPSVSEIYDKIKAETEMPEMISLDEKKLELLYGINLEQVEEFEVELVTANIKSDELAVIKAKEGAVKDVLECVKQRLEEQKESFKDYLPDEYRVLEEAVVESKGDYVLLAVGKDADKMKEIFESCL